MCVCLSLPNTAAAEAIPLEEVNEPVTLIVDTMPGDDDACTDVVPAPEAEGTRILAMSSEQEEREHITQPLLTHEEQQHACSGRNSVVCVSMYLPPIAHYSSR